MASRNAMNGKGSENSNITWSGEAWICNNRLKHFPSFCTGGINIPVYSFVYVLVEDGSEHLAYVKDLFEDKNNLKMVRVQWIYFTKDIEDLTTETRFRDKEVFLSRQEQDIYAECINGLATVLTLDHFDKCSNLPGFITSETFLCHREFRNRTIKHIRFHRLPGYSSQPVVSRLLRHLQKLPEGEGSEKPKLVQEPQKKCLTFNVNDNVEILSQDSSLQSCWYKCKVLQVKQKHLKVQYYDVFLDDDRTKKLEQWIPSHRVANPDVLEMRHAGRLMIRPMPSGDKSTITNLDTGSAVDAWLGDGWWEGVLLGNETCAVNNFQLFFPGEKLFRTIERKNIRMARDWIDGKWKKIIPKPNILSSINSILNTTSPPNVTGTSSNVHNMKRHRGPNDLSAKFSKTIKRKANEERVIINADTRSRVQPL